MNNPLPGDAAKRQYIKSSEHQITKHKNSKWCSIRANFNHYQIIKIFFKFKDLKEQIDNKNVRLDLT